jgi:hypothetical protein
MINVMLSHLVRCCYGSGDTDQMMLQLFRKNGNLTFSGAEMRKGTTSSG